MSREYELDMSQGSIKKVDEFICLEPWYGIADVAGHEGDLEKKAGMQKLGAGESASYDYVVEFY